MQESPSPVDRGATDVVARWVVYASFDTDGAVRPHAVEQVQAYRDLGFEVLVVDASASPSSARAAAWDRHASAWFGRVNEGYDFGSYRAGMAWLAERKVAWDRTALLLTNDSAFGPFRPLAPIVAGFDAETPDRRIVFGLSDSREMRPHLQSYWLYFRPNVASLAAGFLAGDRPIARGRDEAIWFGELGFSSFLLEAGCELRALCPVGEVLDRHARFASWPRAVSELVVRRLLGRPKYGRRADLACLLRLFRHPRAESVLHSPLLAFGLRLVEDGSMPFVKQALLRDNQLGDPSIPPGIDVSRLDNRSAAELVTRLARARRV